MAEPDPAGQKRHPIQVASRWSGLTAHVLRAWEKRYGAVEPGRAEGGRRLYSDADIARLRLMREAIAGGRRIGDIARRSLGELEAIVDEDRAERDGAEAPPSEVGAADRYALEALDAIRRLDDGQLRSALTRAVRALSPFELVDSVVTPLMHRVGELWEEGELTPGHEHLASAVVKQILMELLGAFQPDGDAPVLVVATPAGQRHEIGALLAAASAALEGWRAVYLGGDLPTADIVDAAAQTKARAVALSVMSADERLPEELASLRRGLGRGAPIFVGGQGAPALVDVIAGAGMVYLEDLAGLRSALASLLSS
jgi:methanogenic corrinoid protein MtbC1